MFFTDEELYALGIAIFAMGVIAGLFLAGFIGGLV